MHDNWNDWTHNQHVLYLYDAQMLLLAKPAGIISDTQASPLRRDEIEPVFTALAKHPAYKQQTVICHDLNNQAVILQKGRIL